MTNYETAKSFYQEHCVYLPPMLGWFFFSALLSSYNKYVFGGGHMGFPCPLLLTSIHFSIQWAFSYIVCELFPIQMGTEQVRSMTWKEWASVSIPCGLVTALDVGLSNLSLVTITLTFYTMVKSTTPIFVITWAYIFGIELITWSLIGVVLVIAAGEFLTVVGEVDFVLHGFLLCIAASILSGARWTLVQLKLQSMEPKLKSTMLVMRLLAPSMCLGMLMISLIVERPWTVLASAFTSSRDFAKVFFLGSFGGVLAILMVLCEFYLILRASAIILMIGGVIKEMTTIFIGVSFFGDELNAINLTGCAVVFSGVILYKIVFHLEKEEKEDIAFQKVNEGENVEGTLVRHGGHEHQSDDEDDYEFVPARAVELAGRGMNGHWKRSIATSEETEDLTVEVDVDMDMDGTPSIV